MSLELVDRHVDAFNHGVGTGDFAPMVALFAPDAVLVFDGVPAGPFEGRDAIAAAYREQPPDDTIRLLGVRAENDTFVAEYAWDRSPSALAGELTYHLQGPAITRLTIAYYRD
ncbi:nuclear transport factor 2 family protein [Spirillospora sp. CA-294931]|uniref:nuclear transport factor 2 family protein n=1 Tax=Spirillospora sp. CA-294931 TaxID=3240042 RepID=UPI003D91062B